MISKERRNYLVAKRAVMALNRYANDRRTAIIFRRDGYAKDCRDRCEEHLDVLERVHENLDYTQGEEIYEEFEKSIRTGIITMGNQIDSMIMKLRGAVL